MKTTGIVRNLDNLGRIVLPMELRRTLNIEAHDPIEICMDGNNIVLRKYNQTCVFCGSEKQLSHFKDTCVCEKCKKDLASGKE